MPEKHRHLPERFRQSNIPLLSLICESNGNYGQIRIRIEALEKSESLCDSTDFCTFHRTSHGYAADGTFPDPIGILNNNHVYNNNVQTPKKCAAGVANRSLLHLDVPMKDDDYAISYMVEGLHKMVRDLGNLTKINLDPKRLKNIIITTGKKR